MEAKQANDNCSGCIGTIGRVQINCFDDIFVVAQRPRWAVAARILLEFAHSITNTLPIARSDDDPFASIGRCLETGYAAFSEAFFELALSLRRRFIRAQ